MTTKTIDNGGSTVTLDDSPKADMRFQANAAALAIATAIIKAEDSLAGTAKAWGHFVFATAKAVGSGITVNDLIGENKMAAGWSTLGTSDSGKKAKARLEQYFTNARLIDERWKMLSDEQRVGILDGTVSVHYLANTFRKADAEAAKAKKAEEAKAEGKADISLAPPEGVQTLSDMLRNIMTVYPSRGEDERNEAYDVLAELVAMVDADIEASANDESGEAETLAA